MYKIFSKIGHLTVSSVFPMVKQPKKRFWGILVRHKGILYKAVITDFPKKIENSYVVKGW
jgi:hypothetical protein